MARPPAQRGGGLEGALRPPPAQRGGVGAQFLFLFLPPGWGEKKKLLRLARRLC